MDSEYFRNKLIELQYFAISGNKDNERWEKNKPINAINLTGHIFGSIVLAPIALVRKCLYNPFKTLMC